MFIEIVVILILISANGLFAMSEIAIVSAKKNVLEKAAQKGSRSARTALDLAHDPSNLLSTVQVGITLIGIIAGAYGGASLAGDVAPIIRNVPILSAYSETIAFIIVIGIITYLSLIIGELVPKRLALLHAETIAKRMAPTMYLLSKVMAPAVALLSWSTNGILRLFNVRTTQETAVTEDEVNYLVRVGAEAGIFEPEEKEMVRRVLHLDTLAVDAVMTPQYDIAWYDTQRSFEQNMDSIIEDGHSYFPVCKGSINDVIGIAAVKDVWHLDENTASIDSLITPAIIVPKGVPVLDVLNEFKETGKRMALVVDEFGSVCGLVTLRDIFESITGDIPSHDEPDEIEIVQREDKSWLVDGAMSIYDFVHEFDLSDEFFGRNLDYTTMAGFVLDYFKEIPTPGQNFVYKGWYFEVLDCDGPRIDKLLVLKK